MRGEAWCAYWRHEPLLERDWECTASEEIPSSCETSRPNTLGRSRCCAPFPGWDHRHLCHYFEEITKVNINHSREKRRGAPVRKLESRSRQRLLRGRHPG